ncbi:MAG: antibiotic biosynthesis monooxygenase [Pseudomonadota bacterium]
MYIAMNRFKVKVENAHAFEALWLGRESYLKDMPGFEQFHMLKGPENDGLVLYSSHTVWTTEDDFLAWTKSQSFRDAHKRAGQTKSLHEGHPNFEGFTSIQTISAAT